MTPAERRAFYGYKGDPNFTPESAISDNTAS
jgi:hypothetical protein